MVQYFIQLTSVKGALYLQPKHFFSGSQLKWIAIIAMFLDHTAKIISFRPYITETVPYLIESNQLFELSQVFFPLFTLIGRLAFPIFCFLLVEGFVHTKNVKKYLLRLSLFALISEVPYDLAFSHRVVDLESQNVFFTLVIGLMVIMGVKKFTFSSIQNGLFSLVFISGGLFLAEWFKTDYGGWIGILLIVILYIFRSSSLLKCVLGGGVFLQNSWFGLFAFVPIYFYNGQRGKQWKYFFYWFYPVHLIVLFVIQQWLITPYLI
ncbi:TraX family protein [Enterococcus caccae]|uniref:TraX family protein n=1 Tax=Enterococcus caccae TaxID=317735 RepID=UPI001FDED6F2|nr:TraX family protein [Enterococcus caccae]